MTLGSRNPESVTLKWDQLARKAGPEIPELSPQQFLGWSLFRWVMIALGVGAVLLVGYAVMTWPRPDVVVSLLDGVAPAERAAALRELQADWHEQVRETAQIALVGPLVTILSAVIGYVLGREGRS